MKQDSIAALLDKYYEGNTTLAEEAWLREYFTQEQELPEHLRKHAVQFNGLAQQQEILLDESITDDWLLAKIEKPEQQQKGKQLFMPLASGAKVWRVAASILLLLGVFWAGFYFAKQQTVSQENEMAALRQDVKDLKEALATPENSYSASERIQLVSQEFDKAPDDAVVDALISTMNHDTNVNVRLAACEALYQFKENRKVREAFIQALKQQSDPLMQITLIDMLVNMKEKRAVQPLQELAEKKNLLPIVKDKAAQGVGILI
ncbi:HEAT repeat domain-containing protein [Pontibacter cellulosilyticus]|uniref:HEAT repeat domain-containing protein n=1 Tax=Pontibacter cellulosilyticus TaxID=1720253 RepID=A0A923SPA2_9BACT|nr:HEAT repeat domain-containing protein [Pontibacter cellulosilyticus]MBC5993955.1 HEAT repeat domain-containing protein [Pontibacter cellulosilyticus]